MRAICRFVALALAIWCLSAPLALAQVTEPAGTPNEVVELLRGSSNLQMLIERSLQTPGDDWRRHVAGEQDRLTNLLRSRGYLDGRIEVQYAFVDAGADQRLTVRVEQGDLYRIASIEIGGGEVRGPVVDRIVAGALGSVASTANAAAIASRLTWELGEQGRPAARLVESAFVPDGKRGQAVLKLVLTVPQQARFDSLEIEGSGTDLIAKIQALSPFAKGQLYSNSRLAAFRNAVARLNGTGAARIDAEPQPDGTFRLHVRRVVQQPTAGFDALLGVVLLGATLLVVAQRRVILDAIGSRSGFRLNAANLAVAGLLLVSAVLAFGRVLTFLSGSA